MTVNPDDKAPGFDLPTDGEGTLKLSDLKGRKVVRYYLPQGFDARLYDRGQGFPRPHQGFCKSQCGDRRRVEGQHQAS